MHAIVAVFFAFTAFLSNLFVPSEAAAPMPEEATTATSTAVATTTATGTPPVLRSAPAPLPKAPKLIVPVVKTTATTSAVKTTVASTTATVRTGGGGSIAYGVLLLTSPSLAKVTEKDTLTFSAFITQGGVKTDVTSTATWEVLGSIGTVSKGVFTAGLSGDIAEFGHAPGAVVAHYTDASGQAYEAQSVIFDVSAFVPKVDKHGQ